MNDMNKANDMTNKTELRGLSDMSQMHERMK